MVKLLEEIEEYWSTRTEGYSAVNEKELAGKQKNAWLTLLQRHFPNKKKDEVKILDIGTGPGFFPIILSEAGYCVTAVDCTPEMLKKARENIKINERKYNLNLSEKVTFLCMDAQNLEFMDSSFDVVLSRNLTWNLENPEKAYREWFRVLKDRGIFLNFDANWYGYLYDEEKKKAYEQDRRNVEERSLDDHYLCTDIDTMEKIALQMPLSAVERPQWDIQVLKKIGMKEIQTDTEIWRRVWSEEERLNYGSTPMFMIYGRKE